MAINHLKHWDYGPENSILAFPGTDVSVGIQVNDTGVTANDNGRKIIPAGTPIGGDTLATQDEKAILSVSNDTKAQGVTLHDVDVTDGQNTATLVIYGFINELRMKNVTVTDEAKTALNGKVTFLKRNDI